MRTRFSILASLLFLTAQVAVATPLLSQAAAQLDGEWRSDDFMLKIDARRAQASTDPAHPFEWQHFLVKDATDQEIVFAVGADIYEARIDGDTLTLTGTSFRGERVLTRTANMNAPMIMQLDTPAADPDEAN